MIFHRDGQFPVAQETIAPILTQYDLDEFTFSRSDRGIKNSTCFIDTETGRYALRLYRQEASDIPGITRELQFMDMLRDAAMPVPQVVPNAFGNRVTQTTIEDHAWQAILMDFVPGHHPDSYTPLTLDQMADFQARMHLLGEPFAKDREHTKVMQNPLTEDEFLPLLDISNVPNDALRSMCRRISRFEMHLDKSLPSGYSHFDFDAGNILIDDVGNITGTLDFDDLRFGPFVGCLGITMWHVLYRQGWQQADRYLKRYETMRPLTDQERQCLPGVMLFRHYGTTDLMTLRGIMTEQSIAHHLEMEGYLLEK